MPTGRIEIRKLLGEDPEGFVRQNILDELSVIKAMSDQELLGSASNSLKNLPKRWRTFESNLGFSKTVLKTENS
jgi:hypothetical protein